jgi:hypothetical protein
VIVILDDLKVTFCPLDAPLILIVVPAYVATFWVAGIISAPEWYNAVKIPVDGSYVSGPVALSTYTVELLAKDLTKVG